MTTHTSSLSPAPRKSSSTSKGARGFLLLLLALALYPLTARAQGNVTSPTDGMTPLQLQPGSPEGSYELSGFDNVNLYSGGLSFDLPLIKEIGRAHV